MMREWTTRETVAPELEAGLVTDTTLRDRILALARHMPNTAGKHWQGMREPLPEACRATKDETMPQYRDPHAEVREVWDGAAAKAAGIPARMINHWRQLMGAEPFVRGTSRG